MKVIDIIRAEVTDYLDHEVNIAEGVTFSQHKLYKRIGIFKNRHFPKGKISENAEYKYWFDIIQPRVLSEIKNLRFGSKNVLPFSTNPVKDTPAISFSMCSMVSCIR